MPKDLFKISSVIFFLISSAYGQTAGKISGKIIDQKNNSPLVGANIIIMQTQAGTTADEEGYFNLIRGVLPIRSMILCVIIYIYYTIWFK